MRDKNYWPEGIASRLEAFKAEGGFYNARGAEDVAYLLDTVKFLNANLERAEKANAILTDALLLVVPGLTFVERDGYDSEGFVKSRIVRKATIESQNAAVALESAREVLKGEK